ncbi:hypothetical protein ACJMK2_022200, partial [Sinanodonta woodiana]
FAIDGILFQVPEMVKWSQADQTCQNNGGKLLKPNETLFDVSLFSEYNFHDDLWVAATYIKLKTFVSAVKDDSFTRCEMCQIEESCRTTCLYKGCGDRCNVLCLDPYNSNNHLLSDKPQNWTEAKTWCSEHVMEFGNKIQSAVSLFPNGYCVASCFWTINLIQIKLQTVIAHGNEPGECGILQNGTISFTSCRRLLHPLCERDTGIIIGAVVGSVVFFMFTILGIICVRRKLLKRTFHSNQNTTHKPTNHYQRQDVPLESESGSSDQLESKCEGFCIDIAGQKVNQGKSAFTIDREESNFNYATVAKKLNANSSNLTSKINDDAYDHLNAIRQSTYDNVAGNLYDTTNLEQRNDSTYDISGGYSKTLDEGVGLYDRVNTTICSEYETTDARNIDSNAAYDHI